MEDSLDLINQLFPNFLYFGISGLVGIAFGRIFKGMFTLALYCLGAFLILLYFFQDTGFVQVELDDAQAFYNSNIPFILRWFKTWLIPLPAQLPLVTGFLGGFYLGLR